MDKEPQGAEEVLDTLEQGDQTGEDFGCMAVNRLFFLFFEVNRLI